MTATDCLHCQIGELINQREHEGAYILDCLAELIADLLNGAPAEVQALLMCRLAVRLNADLREIHDGTYKAGGQGTRL